MTTPPDDQYIPMPSPTLHPEVVILANGSFPTHPLPLALLNQARLVVCCDGAANAYIANGYTPEVIVGDGDSLSPENRKRFAHLMYYIPDQETNDLTKSVNYCLSKGLRKIIIVGGSGKREDHTIGNISLLSEYIDTVDAIEMITDTGVFTPIKGDSTFESFKDQNVSVFNFSATQLYGEELEYPLRPFDGWWQGTLNKSLGNTFHISTDGKVLLYRAF